MAVRRFGESTLTTKNNAAGVLRKLERARVYATKEMAEEARRQAEAVFHSDGDGLWDPNSPATVAWKGHEKVMLGRTGTLSEGIEIRTSETLGMKAVGWFDVDHPDSKLSQAGLAWVHEDEFPWLRLVEDNPNHADPVYRAGFTAYRARVAELV